MRGRSRAGMWMWGGTEGFVYQQRWLRNEYVILEEPPLKGWVVGQPGPKVPGTPVVAGAGGRLRKAAPQWPAPWPVGGVFAPTWWPRGRPAKPFEYYNPMTAAADILLDVQRVESEDPKALLRFVNKWGRLGVGVPRDAFFLDGVVLTGRYLTQLKEWIEALEALQHGKKRPRRSSKSLLTRPWTWRDLAFELSEHLRDIHLGAVAERPKLVAVYRPRHLLDALWLELWRQATEMKRSRRCPECRVLFIPGRANQQYCTRLCANRPTVRAWKRKQKDKHMAQARQTEG
jgi:hypothetical protein